MPRKPPPKPPPPPKKPSRKPDKKPVTPPPPPPKPKAKAKPKTKKKPAKKAAKPPPPQDALTYRQRQFVAYFAGPAKGNGTEAARRAGYAFPNVEAVRLLANASIKAAIAARTAAVAMTQDEVLARLSDIASADVGPFLVIDRHGEPRLDLRKLKKAGLTHLIREIKPTAHGVVVKLHDSVRTLDLLGRFHGLFAAADGADDTPPVEKPRLTIPDNDDRSGSRDPR